MKLLMEPGELCNKPSDEEAEEKAVTGPIVNNLP